MKYACGALVYLACLFAVVITIGSPDILDGWIKRANASQCVSVE